MRQEQETLFVQRFLDAWNSQDVERVAACYTDSLIYLDPNTRGEIRDQVSFKRYLTKLFAAWEMTWFSKESFALEGEPGWAFLWRATIGKTGTAKQIELHGMDLVVLEGDRIVRNEVYFDRTQLLPLMNEG